MRTFTPSKGAFGTSSCRTIGVLGGLGPETTSKFYLSLVSKFLKDHAHRPPMLISNVPVHLSVEKQFITTGKGCALFSSLLEESAQSLERGGADFIAIPCNTVHMFIRSIRRSVGIPVLSIVEETAKFLSARNIRAIRIFSTSGSNLKNLFDSEFRQKGIMPVKLSGREQEALDKIILKILSLSATEEDRIVLEQMTRSSELPALLACTDLQHLLKPDSKKIFDTLEILEEASLREMG
ncbi:MAG: amino acid racemase [archaeon]